ncbi:hypothetical protein C8Q70DRAFT_977210 [Cubamyces menziesii]|nr:hypothetical protein C8Q70DRAFT_977210 [Cubamyces menziesii]
MLVNSTSVMAKQSPQTNNTPSANDVARDGRAVIKDLLACDNDYWLSDGNIVLIAKNHHVLSRRVGFQVHRSVLARQSNVLKELLGDGGAPEDPGLETDQYCPVVRMSDSYHDLKILLRVLYDGSTYPPSDEAMLTSEAVALVRLGHKYEINSALSLGLRHLSAVFHPKNVWKTVSLEENDFRFALSGEDAIEAAVLFREIDNVQFLATALFYCSELSFGQLLRGITRADGYTEKLPLEDMERCLQFREWRKLILADFLGRTCSGMPDRPPCCTRTHCNESLIQTLRNDFSRMPDRPEPTYLRSLQACVQCSAWFVQRIAAYKRWVWDHLPQRMDLKVADWESSYRAE